MIEDSKILIRNLIGFLDFLGNKFKPFQVFVYVGKDLKNVKHPFMSKFNNYGSLMSFLTILDPTEE